MGRKVALDLHRRSIYVLICEGGREVLRRRFTNDAAGIAALLAVLQPSDRIVLEATTGVFRLANRLESIGVEVFILDAQETRAVGLKGKKTDYRDCRALLRYLDDPDMPVVWRPDLGIREIRQLTRERFAFNQAMTRLKNRVRGLLADEGLQPPTAPWEPAGRAWLEQQVLSPITRRILTRELAAIAVDEGLKAEQEQELAELALACPLCQRLMQWAGFGAAFAVMWKGEVGDLGRFPGPKQLVSYAGFDSKVNQSGERQRNGRISKAGRAQLRWIMVEVAWRHVYNGGPEAQYFHRLVGRGKPPQVAIVALARRLLVLAYTLLQRGETHRDLNLTWYEAKLTRLAAQRPASAEPEPCDRDWAADRVEELTGQPAPRRAAGRPRRLRPRRRARAEPSASPARALSGRKEEGGSTSEHPGKPEPRSEARRRQYPSKEETTRTKLPETASST